MRLVLVALNAKYSHTNIAVRYLKQHTKDLNCDCLIKEYSINDRSEKVLEDIMLEKPEVVGFSCYIWNIDFVIKLSRLIKEIDETIEILYGGPEVSYDSDVFLKNNLGEYLINGEGEETFREFVEYKLGNRDIDKIRGLYYKTSEGEIRHNENRILLSMNNIYFPYEENENLSNKIVYYEAARGCPFRCKYCLSSTIDGVRFRNIDKVKEELSFLMKKGVPLVKFVDRTFNCDRTFSREIWNFLKNSETNTCFHFEISADILTDDDLEILKSAPEGRFQFEIGVQTTNQKVIENIDRTMNVGKLAEIVKRLRKYNNIKLHLDLIAGLPGENYDSFRNSFNEVYNMGGHEVQLGFLKLLRGSSMREEAEKWGIRFSPFPPYEILKSKDISYDELVKLKKVEEMLDKYHNSGRFSNIISFFIYEFDTPFDFFYELSVFFNKKGYFNRNLSSVDYYKVFIEFNNEIIKKNETELKDIVKYDYIRFNKKNWIPDFLNRNISKEKERNLKLDFARKHGLNTLNRIYIEDFNMDLPHFIKTGECKQEKCYYISSDERIPTEEFYYETIE